MQVSSRTSSRPASPSGLHVEELLVLKAFDDIVALAPQLEVLAKRCGQPGALHWLPYFVHPKVTGRRSPLLVLRLGRPVPSGQPLTADDLSGAALVFEYTLLGRGTGVLTTGDAVGVNTVVAPVGERSVMASLALARLLRDSGAVAVATMEGAAEPAPPARLFRDAGLCSAYQERTVTRVLPLKTSLDATLSQMGKSTRFNLRYYRRRFGKLMTCEYIANAAPHLPLRTLKH